MPLLLFQDTNLIYLALNIEPLLLLLVHLLRFVAFLSAPEISG
jgi:hypothetical protein